MSRSLAFVTILVIVGVAGTWSAVGQDETVQTSQGVVVKSHMSDSERDRLMQEAMEAARRELEQKKSLEQAEKASEAEAQKQKADAAAVREREAAAATEQRRKLAAEQKAREERLAAELTEAEKQASDTKKAADTAPKDLDSLEPLQSSLPNEKHTEKASENSSSKKTVSKPSQVKSSSSKSGEPKKAASGASVEVTSAKAKEEPAEEPEKTVVKTVSTRDPGAGLSVKTSMPTGDAERRAEQQAAASGRAYDSQTPSNSTSLSGQVVGMMRSRGGPPRILVNCEDQRMVQVIIEKSRAEIPASGSYVSIVGRELSGGRGPLVVSASSVKVESGRAVPGAPQVTVPEMVAAPPVMPRPVMGPPPPHILGGMPHPPLPMIGAGPGPMLSPPPPF